MLLISFFRIIIDSLEGHDVLTSCGKYPAEMTLVDMVSTIDLYIYILNMYILCAVLDSLRLCV